ncbi:MAG: hemerythrin domain-containing protein [Pseudomonadota bacterium]|nr:hemerythrin domain-containing protein [Pseudomonadota bacterium]
MDITQLILDDHYEQRRLFAILDQIPDDNTAALGMVWRRLSTFLGTHAKAEEKLFYPRLLADGQAGGEGNEAKSETKDAIKDHNEIRDAIAAVGKNRTGSPEWRKAVQAVNKANGDHMAEEEREGLTLFRQKATLTERHDLAVAFISFEIEHLEGVTPANPDPERWVEQHG